MYILLSFRSDEKDLIISELEETISKLQAQRDNHGKIGFASFYVVDNKGFLRGSTERILRVQYTWRWYIFPS